MKNHISQRHSRQKGKQDGDYAVSETFCHKYPSYLLLRHPQAFQYSEFSGTLLHAGSHHIKIIHERQKRQNQSQAISKDFYLSFRF